ncbi:MAG TPA: hypothetical protein VKC64_07230 [Burkholderiales bacterium]|nr:hypothetical protein [Burkholderiales bacterium]
MEDITHEALLHKPDLLDRALRAARCERAEVTGRLLLAALQALFSWPTRPATKHDLRTSASA